MFLSSSVTLNCCSLSSTKRNTPIVQVEVQLSHLLRVEANEFVLRLSQRIKKILMVMIRNCCTAACACSEIKLRFSVRFFVHWNRRFLLYCPEMLYIVHLCQLLDMSFIQWSHFNRTHDNFRTATATRPMSHKRSGPDLLNKMRVQC